MLTSTNEADGKRTQTWTYHPDASRKTRHDTGAPGPAHTPLTRDLTSTHRYDAFGRLTSITADGDTIRSYAYDGFDRLIRDTQTLPASKRVETTMAYDPLDRTRLRTVNVQGREPETARYGYLGFTEQVAVEEEPDPADPNTSIGTRERPRHALRQFRAVVGVVRIAGERMSSCWSTELPSGVRWSQARRQWTMNSERASPLSGIRFPTS